MNLDVQYIHDFFVLQSLEYLADGYSVKDTTSILIETYINDAIVRYMPFQFTDKEKMAIVKGIRNTILRMTKVSS
jgi:hypothetical protein